ncbi:MAG: glycosyltransferase family 4 protein, partial [Actinomycetota bacterium]|nr:glycosyltransferase family 4 protein [Actinomycetota bacterium]
MSPSGNAHAGGLVVLRLCSVYQLSDGADLDPSYDPVGGMQTHTALLTRELDARGVAQLVVTSRLSGPRALESVGELTAVRRVGLHTRWLRQLWAPAALRAVLPRRGRIDLVHA